METLVAVAVAFLLGTVPTGLWVVRLVRGVDVRHTGSGNIGATNVVRAAGWGWGLISLFLDALKGGLVPYALAYGPFPAGGELVWWQIAAGAAALAGNIFNPFLRFRGGKGVGTAIGVAAVIAPVPFLAGILAFALLFATTRIVSVGSLSAGLAFGAAAVVVFARTEPGPPGEWLAFCLVLAAMIFVTHRANLRRLWSGKETRLTRSE